ncbi:hypothetical protein K6W36_15510 [Acetobacter senegalensis]|uniref:hypothetical protein n=1 Tax=Acetobacter senegalensis TaxID=446692 RepID=UPI001EDB09FC|nr:hypothetical protein [Acetobacter senegalensis]MCG4261964.1 hypothetical protein [Acetobacter senegalensis]
MIIVLSPGLYRAATILASMAIASPKTTAGAPAGRPKQREGWQDRNFVDARGMGEAQGKKVADRRCARAGRGEAGLRADRPYREAMVCGPVSLVGDRSVCRVP